MKLHHVPALLVLLLGGCASNREIVFDRADTTSFALLAVAGMSSAKGYFFEFQQVDRTSSAFLDDYFTLSFDSLVGDEIRKPGTLSSSFRFAGKAVPAGEHAVVAKSEFSAHGTGSNREFSCFSQGAPVFVVKAGRVEIIPLGDVDGGGGAEGLELRTQVDELMTAHSKVTAPVTRAEYTGSLTFEVAEWRIGQRPCKPVGPFSLRQPE